MYKCKECGKEFEEKPDYCDCGNDEFEEEADTNDTVVTEEIVQETKSAEILQNKTIEDKPKVQPASAINFHKPDEKLYVSKRTLSPDPLSLTIFAICILLSLYVIFFAFNSNSSSDENNNSANKPEQTSVQKNIPSVDKIWNNTLPVVKKEEPKKEENIIKQLFPVQPAKKTEIPKQTKTTNNSKATKIPQTKVDKTVLKKSTQTNTQTKKSTNVNTQEQTKAAADASALKKAEQERIAAETALLKKLQEEQAKKAAEQKAKQTQASKQELISYKASLRNAIGKKIDFTRVIGDGSCTVSFKIDGNGKLTNRSFTKQSSNNTLNDEVYAAVMATPSFTPPPAAYNNEFLNLNIKFSNGNFEITLP